MNEETKVSVKGAQVLDFDIPKSRPILINLLTVE